MKRAGMVMFLMALLALASPVFGAVVIDFGTGIAGTGGVFTLLGGGNAKGVGIPIGTVTITGAPMNNGVFAVGGTAVGSNCAACGSLDFNTQTNTVTITGTIAGLGINVAQALLTGSFTSFTANNNGLLNATGPDTKSPALLAAIGAPGLQFGFFGFSLTTNGQSPDSVVSTDMRNTGVPEPSAIVLLGTVLAGVTLLRKRLLAS